MEGKEEEGDFRKRNQVKKEKKKEERTWFEKGLKMKKAVEIYSEDLYDNGTRIIYICHGKVNVKVGGVLMFIGTGPLACLSLFPVAKVDKESWD